MPKETNFLLSALSAATATKIGSGFVEAVEWSIASALEGVRRFYYHFDPRLYHERKRLLSVTDGTAPKLANKFAVLVVYSYSTLPNFTLNLITALNRAAYNLIIVSNAPLKKDAKLDLLRRCCLLVERDNFGRDFGAYKDGITIAFRRFQNMERLIIANDSVFYLESGLDELIASLTSQYDFVGVSEVFEHHYHVASFLLSFGPRILQDPVFLRFWSRYLPIPTRMWAIMKGEGELTKCLIDAGYRPHILFKAESLLTKLQELRPSGVEAALSLFPTTIRSKLLPTANEIFNVRNGFAKAVVQAILERNQMHVAGFAFMKYLGLPLFKRDLIYRELFILPEIQRIMDDLGIDARPEIIADLTSRVPPSRLKVIRRILFHNGFI